MADSEPISSSISGPSPLPDPPIALHLSQGSRKRRRSSKRSTISPEPGLSKGLPISPEYTPTSFIGSAALLDEQRAKKVQADIAARQTSPNPAQQALGNLLSSQSSSMSRPTDAPSEVANLSKTLPEVVPSIQVPPRVVPATSHGENAVRTTPPRIGSRHLVDAATAIPNTANGSRVSSPGRMDGVQEEEVESPQQSEHGRPGNGAGLREPDEGRSNKAFTYPGPMLSAQAQRSSSLPQSGHHNLKSHLLTHSHEKPYSCDTCDARFRRLHDLKRHTKLHTGERPHVCPRCDRSFARGDALARHTKGQGGCAGRRSSMGSFGGDDRDDNRMGASDGDSMPGVMYTAEASHEPEHMDEGMESPSGRSLPSIRKHDAPPDDHNRKTSEHQSVYQPRQPSTYPPVAARPPQGGLYPPPSASPRIGSGPSSGQSSLNQSSYPPGSTASTGFPPPGSNVFAQGGMTESPKPLSPGAMTSHQLGQPDSGMHRNRSPSLTQQFQQQQFGRRTTGHNASPSMNLPPPHSNAPQLPSLPGLTPPEPRYTLHSQPSASSHLHLSGPNSLPGPPHGPNSPSFPPGHASSANNSLSSTSTGPHTSFDRAQLSHAPPHDMWSYVQALESKINRLESEVISLKGQLSAATLPQSR
ncbi:hypothetical protein MMC21_004605 [Puttea exsequens]|nr:hypothetical protein [Puttea exsequens]